MRLNRALAAWALLAVAMVAHGALRESLLTPHLGEGVAHRIGCLTGSLVVLAITYALSPWLELDRAPRRQIRLGVLWLLLTVAFEFGFGRWVAGHSWSRLLADYDVLRGRLWVLVLLTTLLAPRLAGRLRERRARRREHRWR